MRALTEVSFEVCRGEVFGLLGPSGSGKSTVLRILAGRLSPTGNVRVFGRPPRRRSARLRVGYLPQRRSHNQSRLAKVIGVLRNWLVPRALFSRSKPSDVIPESERRLLLKQVLARNPELLLLDEPFAGLDAPGCAGMKDLILECARRGKTVILTGSSLTGAKEVCDRFAVCYAGRLEAIGSLDDILATTDAIRAVGRVLPQETAQRVLSVLREELCRTGSTTEPPISAPKEDLPIAAPATVTEPPAVAPTADEVLAPLVGAPRTADSSQVPEPIASPVNHQRLAALTKPAPGATPHE